MPWFAKSGVSKNRGFEKSEFHCINVHGDRLSCSGTASRGHVAAACNIDELYGNIFFIIIKNNSWFFILKNVAL